MKNSTSVNETKPAAAPTRPQSNLGRVLQNIQRHDQARAQLKAEQDAAAAALAEAQKQEDTEGSASDTSPPPPPTSEDPESKTDADPVSPLANQGNWLYAPPAKVIEYALELEKVKSTFKDVAEDDPTMVSEYADDIFDYMGRLEVGDRFYLRLENKLTSRFLG